jgi:hypothetical protein
MFDVLAAAAIIAMSSPQLAPVDTTTVTVQEDEPGWSCAEMGNRTADRTTARVCRLAEAVNLNEAPSSGIY